MADNVTANSIPVATRSVTYSGDAGQNAQVVGIVVFSGSDDAKTATDLTGDGTNGLDVDVTRLPSSSSATLANVNDTASSTTLISSNSARKGFAIFNDSNAALYVKFGTTASSTSFTVRIEAGGFYTLYGAGVYTGDIDGIWSFDDSGAARTTEW